MVVPLLSASSPFPHRLRTLTDRLPTSRQLGHWEQQFTEPLQEYTQFSNIIKGLLKYRHNKHLQYEAARELLEHKRAHLEELERSELEAQRLHRALERVHVLNDQGEVSPAPSSPSREEHQHQQPSGVEAAGSAPLPSLPSSSSMYASTSGTSSSAGAGGAPRKSGGGLLSALSHSVRGFVDQDPEATRRNSIGKTREQINQVRLADPRLPSLLSPHSLPSY